MWTTGHAHPVPLGTSRPRRLAPELGQCSLSQWLCFQCSVARRVLRVVTATHQVPGFTLHAA